MLLSVACAPRRAITIEPRLDQGTVLRYAFDADVRTTLSRTSASTIRSTLTGRVELIVLEVTDQGSLLRITVTPDTSTRDGIATEPGPSQTREVLLQPSGVVIENPDEQNLGDAALQPDLLATVLHPDVPSPLAHPGERWRDDGSSGRLIGLDRAEGRDLAELLLLTEHEVSRQRSLDGRPIELEGTEETSTTLLWDLDAGIPTRAELRSVASLQVRAGALLGGTVRIDASTTVSLLDQDS